MKIYAPKGLRIKPGHVVEVVVLERFARRNPTFFDSSGGWHEEHADSAFLVLEPAPKPKPKRSRR